jgi:O-antigen/teichoic acid export membrane protein
VSSEPKATGAGRGVLYIAGAKFYFLFVGLIANFMLPNILGIQRFGRFYTINTFASWCNNVAVTGTIQTVSRFTTQEPDKARAVQRAGLRLHLMVGLPAALACVAAAPLAASLLRDPEKMVPLMLAGAIVGGYAFYAVFVGTANGTHQFHKQAGLDVTFATTRTIGMLGMAFAGLGVIGVIGGWVAAVGVILCVAIAWVGLPGRAGRASSPYPVRPLLAYFASVAVYLLLFNALMFVDNWMLELLVSQHDSTRADTLNGGYGAAQQLARVSYQAIIAATFVVFPLVSRSTFTADRETTRRYIQITTRYSLMFATAIAVVIAASPRDMLGLLYKPEYVDAGGPPLVLLAFGHIGFGVFSIAGTILNGAGRSRAAIASAAVTLALAAVGNALAISFSVDSPDVLRIAASVTCGAMMFGAVITGWQLQRVFGATMPLVSVTRIALATCGAFLVGRYLPLHDRGKLMALVLAAVVGVTFVVLLVAMRELGARDLQAIRAVRAKRGPGGDV